MLWPWVAHSSLSCGAQRVQCRKRAKAARTNAQRKRAVFGRKSWPEQRQIPRYRCHWKVYARRPALTGIFFGSIGKLLNQQDERENAEELTGVETRRIHVDKGYRGHNHPHRFRVWISGQVRRVTASIRREMSAALPWSRSSAISRPSTAWAAITSRDQTATASMPSWPPPATTCMGLMVSSGDVRSVYLLLCGCPGPSGLRAVADRS